MSDILLLATAWGPKHGGINAFNMDFATALADYLKARCRVFCAVLSASRDERDAAQARGVTLVSIDRYINASSYDESWAHTVREQLQVGSRPSTHRLTLITFGRMDRESDRIKQGGLAVAGFASAVRSAHQPGMPTSLRENPQMRVIGISEEEGAEEAALRSLAHDKAKREINLLAQPFDDNRTALFDQLGRANIALMLSWHEGFGLTGWEAIAAEVPLIVSRQSGLFRLVDEVLGAPGTACLQTVDVQGREGDDDTSNFTDADEQAVRDAVLRVASELPRAQENARVLKQLLQQELVCTWKNTARQFCKRLGLEPQQPSSPGRAPLGHGGTSRAETPARAEHIDISAPEKLLPLIAMPEQPWPVAVDMPDSLMLLPQSEIVPFHSYRQNLLGEALAWALTEDQPIKLRLQAGEGGTGKTRLAIEACRKLAENEWSAGFLRQTNDIEREFRKLLLDGRDYFVIIDYAETRAADVIALVRGALGVGGKSKVRLLLLARDGGDWWDRLADGAKGDAAVAAVLRSPSTKAGPYRMSEAPVAPEARMAIFEEALASFAEAKRTEISSVTAPDLHADYFGQIFFIHLAALAALRGFAETGDRELLDMAIGHERAYWRRLLEGVGLNEAWFDALEQVVALLTLVDGGSSAREAKMAIGRTPRLRGQPLEIKEKLFELLRRLYRRGGGVAGLQPDLLGERLVAAALARDDELIDVALEEPSTHDQARNSLTVLTRMARWDPAERRWLERALERHIANRAHEAFEVALETGSPMPEAIAASLRSAERATKKRLVRILRPHVPEDTVNLKGLAVDLAEHHVLFLKTDKRDRGGWKAAKQFADAYRHLAARHEAAGELMEAATIWKRTLHFAEIMAKSEKSSDRASATAAHQGLSIALSKVGRFESALTHAESAEAIVRQLAERQPDAYRADWASSLANLGNHLRALGRFEEALSKAKQAELIRRELAERQPDAYRADWAKSLGGRAPARCVSRQLGRGPR